MINSVRFERENCDRMQFNVLNDSTGSDDIMGGLGGDSPGGGGTISGSATHTDDPLGAGNVSSNGQLHYSCVYYAL